MIVKGILSSVFLGAALLGGVRMKPVADVCQLKIKNVNGNYLLACHNQTCNHCGIGISDDGSLAWCECDGQILLTNDCYAEIQTVQPNLITCVTLQCGAPGGCVPAPLPGPGLTVFACGC